MNSTRNGSARCVACAKAGTATSSVHDSASARIMRPPVERWLEARDRAGAKKGLSGGACCGGGCWGGGCGGGGCGGGGCWGCCCCCGGCSGGGCCGCCGCCGLSSGWICG